jgi:hypothetical protein
MPNSRGCSNSHFLLCVLQARRASNRAESPVDHSCHFIDGSHSSSLVELLQLTGNQKLKANPKGHKMYVTFQFSNSSICTGIVAGFGVLFCPQYFSLEIWFSYRYV